MAGQVLLDKSKCRETSVRPIWDLDADGSKDRVNGQGESEGGDMEEDTVKDDEFLEEARVAKSVNVPVKPSQQEVNEHMLTHLPFRSWCMHCVKGKSKGKPHLSKVLCDKSHDVPTVALDYMWMEENDKEE